MYRILFGVLALSLCFSACKKDDKPQVLDKEELVKAWKVTEDPTVAFNDLTGPGAPFNSFVQKLESPLDSLFKKDNVFTFKGNDTLVVTRNGKTYPGTPSKWTIENNQLVFPGWVKFNSSINGDTQIWSAGNAELAYCIIEQLKAHPEQMPSNLVPAEVYQVLNMPGVITGQIKVTLTAVK